MGWIMNLKQGSEYQKQQCKRAFWRIKAAMKKAGGTKTKKKGRFGYDPSSYALNFDDGCYDLRQEHANSSLSITDSTFFYLIIFVIYYEPRNSL